MRQEASGGWRISLGMPVAYDFGSKEFDEAVRAAFHQAFLETLAAGLPVF